MKKFVDSAPNGGGIVHTYDMLWRGALRNRSSKAEGAIPRLAPPGRDCYLGYESCRASSTRRGPAAVARGCSPLTLYVIHGQTAPTSVSVASGWPESLAAFSLARQRHPIDGHGAPHVGPGHQLCIGQGAAPKRNA